MRTVLGTCSLPCFVSSVPLKHNSQRLGFKQWRTLCLQGLWSPRSFLTSACQGNAAERSSWLYSHVCNASLASHCSGTKFMSENKQKARIRTRVLQTATGDDTWRRWFYVLPSVLWVIFLLFRYLRLYSYSAQWQNDSGIIDWKAFVIIEVLSSERLACASTRIWTERLPNTSLDRYV